MFLDWKEVAQKEPLLEFWRTIWTGFVRGVGGSLGEMVGLEFAGCYICEGLTLAPRLRHLLMQQKVHRDILRWAFQHPIAGVSVEVVE